MQSCYRSLFFYTVSLRRPALPAGTVCMTVVPCRHMHVGQLGRVVDSIKTSVPRIQTGTGS